jgi:hypothetical protein
MGKITSATIRPCSSGYAQNMVPTAPAIAQVDAQLSEFGLDGSPSGDTVTGVLSLQQDPTRPSFHPSITGSFTVSAAGAVVGTGPAGSLVCAGTIPTYSATRTRRVRFSPLELTRSQRTLSGSTITAGNAPEIDSTTGGVTQSAYFTPGFSGFPGAQMSFPLTKPHNGATVTSIVFYYYWDTIVPVVSLNSGKASYVKVNVATGAVTTIGSQTYPSSFSFQVPQSVTISGLSDTMDMTTYVYRLAIQDLSVGGSSEQPNPIYTGLEVNYTSIADESFSQ